MANQSSAQTVYSPVVTGLFRDLDKANRAYQAVVDLGYAKESINVVMSDETRDRFFLKDRPLATERGNKALEGAGVGGAIGGAVGALLGAIATIGATIVVPGLGLVVAGPIAAVLAAAGAGSLTGGIIGTLVGAGIPEERAKHYEQGIKGGGVLISVTPRTEADAERIEQEWKRIGGELVQR